MKKISVFIVVAMLFSFQPGENYFSQFYALEGTWLMKTGKGFIGETWKKTDKKSLQSKGFFIHGKDTSVNERVLLRQRKDGIFFTSTVEDQNNRMPVDFKLKSVANKTFVFENLEHDFPKRIVYEVIGKDSLHAWIDDGKNGSARRQDFYYKKQP